jgi:hypothetical protein
MDGLATLRISEFCAAEDAGERYEVLCPRCGDHGGPLEGAAAALRQLRGPYDSIEGAMAVLNAHNMRHLLDSVPDRPKW